MSDVAGAFPLNGQRVNAAHNGGGLVVDNPFILVSRIEPIPVNGGERQPLAGIASHFHDGFDFAAYIAQIQLVGDIQKRCVFCAVAVLTVDVVADGDKADALFPEENLRVKSSLEVVPPNPGHILRDDNADVARLHFDDETPPVRPVEILPRKSVINEMDGVQKAVLGGVVLQHGFLILDR